jgi:hypothetical protein
VLPACTRLKTDTESRVSGIRVVCNLAENFS